METCVREYHFGAKTIVCLLKFEADSHTIIGSAVIFTPTKMLIEYDLCMMT